MKKFLSILVVLAAVSGAVNANVIDNPKSNTGLALMKSESGFKVFYKGSKAGTVRVTITNDKGESIFRETLKNVESFMRPYNLSSITEGDYKIEISSPDGKQIEKFSYTKNKIEKLMNLLHVKDSDGKVVLTVANKNGNDRLRVNIFDQNYNLVYTASENISGDFAKVYDLKSLGENFTFEVSDRSGSKQTLSLTN